MFTSEAIISYLEPFDWLLSTAVRLKFHFPQECELQAMNNLTCLAIHRYSRTSFTCGISDMMAGRVVYCLKGFRIFLGMSLSKVATTFKEQFKQAPTSLRQCASWVHQMSLELLMSDGFYCMIGAGDVLVLPPNHVILEASLGDQDECDVVSWPCLLRGGHEWRVEFAQNRSSSFLSPSDDVDEAYHHIVQNIRSGMNVLEKLLLLSDVKAEVPSGVPTSTTPMKEQTMLLDFNDHQA